MYSDPPSTSWLGDVRSETGTLRRVLVHRPGRELDRITAENATELLFDEVPVPALAREEHDALTATLREAGVEIFYLTDLLAGALGITTDRAASLIAGDGAGARPLPNTMFVRDTSAWLGSRLIIGADANPLRRRESELIAGAYAGHAAFAGPSGGVRPLRMPGVECGDVFCLSERAALVGVSGRTQVGAVERLAKALFAAGFERVLAVEIPIARAAIHLDCLMTLVDTDLLLIDHRLRDRAVVEMRAPGGRVGSRIHLGVAAALTDALGLGAMRTVEVADEREQWTLAANVLAVGPGRVVAYSHNPRTNQALVEAGVEVLAVAGEQLGRGHGGPRCLTCPLTRDAAPSASPLPGLVPLTRDQIRTDLPG
jgi:arginine deiminase